MFSINSFTSFIKQLNRKRLERKKEKIIFKDDSAPRHIDFPKTIKRILFIVTSGGFGDAIYLAGLFKTLSEDGYFIDIATINLQFPRFSNLAFIETCFRLENTDDCLAALEKQPDILIDLTWNGIKFWEIRNTLLKKATCYKATTSPICAKLNLFDAHTNFWNVAHISKRLAFIRNFIQEGEGKIPNEKNLSPILPYIQISNNEETNAQNFIHQIKTHHQMIVLLNGIAGEQDRCLSDAQIQTILDKLKTFKSIRILLKNDLCQRLSSNQIVALPTTSFTEFAAICKNCDVIISVDTSVIHIASAFNKPTIGIFAPNDRDFYPKYSTYDTYAPISDLSFIESFDDPALVVDELGIRNVKMQYMNTIPADLLANHIYADLQKILIQQEKKIKCNQ